MSIELATHPTDTMRFVLSGPTMGTRWSAVFHAAATIDARRIEAALQATVGQVDDEMSTYKSNSAISRFNTAPVGEWVEMPDLTMRVITAGLEIGRLSGGMFDIGLGRAVAHWGFGADADAVGDEGAAPGSSAAEALHLHSDGSQIMRSADIRLDLSAIAKGFGVDCLADLLESFGVTRYLVGIDGEMRAGQEKPDGSGWLVGIEAPDVETRGLARTIELCDAAIATSGDYRHRRQVGARTISHTLDPRSGAPLANAPASVTVIAPDAMQADAWATALGVMGTGKGLKFAEAHALSALFMFRHDSGLSAVGTGLFALDFRGCEGVPGT
ncbi:FAD:protein FMN transferase [Cucumibacter marinus]|uniref:FAD:protein FMN transferase n=1 Tax=Cucumibacter marinus TaxID=1121252 RepID=UPI001FE08265|nr:FAD:protein FMN transferase [Cucumibacter marinus]